MHENLPAEITNSTPCQSVRSSSERARQWRLANPQKVTAYNKKRKASSQEHYKKWRQANPEKLRQKLKQWKTENPEKRNIHSRKWEKKNPLKIKTIQHNRRGRKQSAAGHHETKQLQDRLDYYGNCCWMCGGIATAVDHVKPLAKGGSNWPANLRPACSTCNSRKRHNWVTPSQSLKVFLAQCRQTPITG